VVGREREITFLTSEHRELQLINLKLEKDAEGYRGKLYDVKRQLKTKDSDLAELEAVLEDAQSRLTYGEREKERMG
jgi:chromosome segregation ATPase